MITNARKSFLIFATTLASAALVLVLFLPREPVYKGRPLTAWLQDVVDMPTPGVLTSSDIARRSNGEEAVKQIGAGAVPTLARLMRARDSTLRLKVKAFCAKRPWLGIHFRPPADKLQYWGTQG